jgi:hypothetical protein
MPAAMLGRYHAPRIDDVAYWHKADISAHQINVRFRVNSGHRDQQAP